VGVARVFEAATHGAQRLPQRRHAAARGQLEGILRAGDGVDHRPAIAQLPTVKGTTGAPEAAEHPRAGIVVESQGLQNLMNEHRKNLG
jgi:hypothetical protein